MKTNILTHNLVIFFSLIHMLSLYGHGNTELLDPQTKNTFLVKDQFTIAGRGTVLSGIVTKGIIKKGDRFVHQNSSNEFICTGIIKKNKTISTAVSGSRVGVLLRGSNFTSVKNGDKFEVFRSNPRTNTPSKKFVFVPEDALQIPGRGTVLVGKITQGKVKVTDDVILLGLGYETKTLKVTGIEVFRKLVDSAVAGDDTVGILLRGLPLQDVKPTRGFTLTTDTKISVANVLFVEITPTKNIKINKNKAHLSGLGKYSSPLSSPVELLSKNGEINLVKNRKKRLFINIVPMAAAEGDVFTLWKNSHHVADVKVLRNSL